MAELSAKMKHYAPSDLTWVAPDLSLDEAERMDPVLDAAVGVLVRDLRKKFAETLGVPPEAVPIKEADFSLVPSASFYDDEFFAPAFQHEMEVLGKKVWRMAYPLDEDGCSQPFTKPPTITDITHEVFPNERPPSLNN